MPWPNCSANAASSSGNPKSSAFGHSAAISPVVTPGRTLSMAMSRISRQYL